MLDRDPGIRSHRSNRGSDESGTELMPNGNVPPRPLRRPRAAPGEVCLKREKRQKTPLEKEIDTRACLIDAHSKGVVGDFFILSAIARFHRRDAETPEKKNIPQTRPGCLHRIPQQRPGSRNRIPETQPGCLHRISLLCAFVGDSSSSCPVGPLDPARPVTTGTATVL